MSFKLYKGYVCPFIDHCKLLISNRASDCFWKALMKKYDGVHCEKLLNEVK